VKSINSVGGQKDVMPKLAKTAANELGSITIVFGY